MKTQILILITTITVVMFGGVSTATAQGNSIYFMKDGNAVYSSPITDIDSVFIVLTPRLSVKPSLASFSAAATESCDVVVSTNQPQWNVTSNQTWCTVTKGMNQFTVTATANTTDELRIATITVSAGMFANVTIEARQSGVNPVLSISPDTPISFTSGSGTSDVITVTTNQSPWDATSNQTWCTVAKGTDQFTVKATANTNIVSRTATVTVTAGDAPDVTLSVSQAAITPAKLSVTKSPGGGYYSGITAQAVSGGAQSCTIPTGAGTDVVTVAPGTYRIAYTYWSCYLYVQCMSSGWSGNFTVSPGQTKNISLVGSAVGM